jgi:hypothetical protein
MAVGVGAEVQMKRSRARRPPQGRCHIIFLLKIVIHSKYKGMGRCGTHPSNQFTDLIVPARHGHVFNIDTHMFDVTNLCLVLPDSYHLHTSGHS